MKFALRITKLGISVLLWAGDRLCRLLRNGRVGTCVVLYYHSVPNLHLKRFEQQMLFVGRRAKPIGLCGLDAWSGSTHAVAVTFDDAMESFAENALPVLLRLKIPATVFAVTEALGRRPEWTESYYSADEQVMSAEKLRGLPDLITVGSHTLTHANLVTLPPDAAAREIAASRGKLEALLCRPVKFFSFPFGAFSTSTVRQCREAGYGHVFTTVPALASPEQFVIGRVAADPWDWWLEFRLKTLGAYRWLPYASALKHRILAFFSAAIAETNGDAVLGGSHLWSGINFRSWRRELDDSTMTGTALAAPVKYVIVTPARDEAHHIENTIRSMVSQSVKPAQWIIVDDGSSDKTGEIIDHYAGEYRWITPVHGADRGERVNGSGPMQAFYRGMESLSVTDWEFLVKLDADLSFAPDYFEKCFAEFASDARLGIGGGLIVDDHDGVLKIEPVPKFHVRGATKIYKRSCWEALGGLIAAPGWDTIDEVKANMCGWTTRNFPYLRLEHHRPTGAADGYWRNAVKDGCADYISGYHPLFMCLKCVKRLFRYPFIMGSAGLAYGFLDSYRRRIPQVADPELIRYVRNQQLRRLFLMSSIWK